MMSGIKTWLLCAAVWIGGTVFSEAKQPCLLRKDRVIRYETMLHWMLQPIRNVDEVRVQCARSLLGYGQTLFSEVNPSLRETVIRESISVLKEVVITGLDKGTLYGCRCISSNDESNPQWRYISELIHISTVYNFTLKPTMLERPLKEIRTSEERSELIIKHRPIAQDCQKLSLQLTSDAPPIWNSTEISLIDPSTTSERTNGDCGSITQHTLQLTAFPQASYFAMRLKITNQNGVGFSRPINIITSSVFLRFLDIDLDEGIPQASLVPRFEPHSFHYFVTVDEACESLRLRIGNILDVIRVTVKRYDRQINANFTGHQWIPSEEFRQKFIKEPSLNDVESGDPLTPLFDLSVAGNLTEFVIVLSEKVQYSLTVVRSQDLLGLPKYQEFGLPTMPKCPKQKRVFVVIDSVWVAHKEYFLGFLTFVAWLFIGYLERSTREKPKKKKLTLTLDSSEELVLEEEGNS